MYEFLCRKLPPPWATAVLFAWYVAVILAILWCWDASPAEFRYGRL
jgi:hypothetical protein